MLMDAGREVAIAVLPQWLRCDHRGTALDVASGEVTLAWAEPALSSQGGRGPGPVGLGTGRDGGAYPAMPGEGRIIGVPGQPGPGKRAGGVAEEGLSPAEPPPAGAFASSGAAPVPRVAA